MLLKSIRTGFKKGIKTTWMLAKIIIPVYIIVTLLQYTPVFDRVAEIFKPALALFNLPGEAAVVLVLGNAVNLYAAIGAMEALKLTGMEITIIATMLSFSHSLFVETAITKKLGLGVFKVVLIRLGLAIVVGLIMGRIGVLL